MAPSGGLTWWDLGMFGGGRGCRGYRLSCSRALTHILGPLKPPFHTPPQICLTPRPMAALPPSLSAPFFPFYPSLWLALSRPSSLPPGTHSPAGKR